MAWPFKSLLLAASLVTHVGFLDAKSHFRQNVKSTTSEPEDLELEVVRFGAILPKTSLITVSRQYNKKITDSLETLTKGRNAKFSFGRYQKVVKPLIVPLPLDPSPTVVLNALCQQMLPENVISILYLTNAEVYGSNAASAQYLLQLTGYLGIPVIAWNADNIGLEKNQRLPQSQVLQLAPSVEHQSSAMLSILRRYSWHKFAIVTSQIGGHDDFVRAIRDQVLAIVDFKFTIMDIYTLKARDPEEARHEMLELANSEARVFLLYCNRQEAMYIMRAANELDLTGKNYIWIVTQSIVGPAFSNTPPPPDFPPGLLGIHFNTTMHRLMEEIERSVKIFVHGLEQFLEDPQNVNMSLAHNLNCTSNSDIKWNKGEHFFKYLRNVSIKEKGGKADLEFNLDGTLKYVELEVMNLNNMGFWEKIGVWTEDGLDIKDIVWPGDSPVPPPGVPEKFNMKITFMEEPPYVNLVPPDNETGECETSRAVRCRVAPRSAIEGANITMAMRNSNYFMCCSGFCIDLLQKFANDLRFSYDLYRVEDGIWGVFENNTWNGLIKEILDGNADMVVTSIKINSERQKAVDFTVPFMETGIAIVVAKKTGIISPKAFLEPFDTTSWLMILLISIQFAAIAIFFFEWLSPSGYDMKMLPPREHRFSLFRTYWLVWAILFGAAVNVDCPRGYTARFMSNVWAMFAVVFLAIYTANLAAFMITREEFYDLTGIEDERLYNPRKTTPPFRYGTIPHGNTEAVLRVNKPELFQYMKAFKKKTVLEGIRAVKKSELDAFIYDATVLEYLVGQDNECRLLTVGSWYAMTGYGFAMPKESKYLQVFNKKMIEYRENGDIERLQRFWLQGVCKPQNQKRNASNPLDINQFMSAFLLLGCGVLFTLFLLGLEHVYFFYVRKHISKKDNGGCCTLVSLSMGKSLSFRGAVYEAQDLIKHHRCKDPVCDTQLWKVKHELDMARIRIRKLESFILTLQGNNAIPAINQARDLTRNHVITNEPIKNALAILSKEPITQSYTEIAEIETVL
nr:glutamate receptor ionotropic, NMDA 2B isoform X1 [Parasteatoda tepidariorum]XP_042910482.1 glutamate receptor ionotropic, NMDA 2B isoform X1 [Parasteatoda tepidariorum]